MRASPPTPLVPPTWIVRCGATPIGRRRGEIALNHNGLRCLVFRASTLPLDAISLFRTPDRSVVCQVDQEITRLAETADGKLFFVEVRYLGSDTAVANVAELSIETGDRPCN